MPHFNIFIISILHLSTSLTIPSYVDLYEIMSIASFSVYFSSGTDRTGTFIALDHLLDKLCNSDHIDVFEVVQNLILQRVHMISNMVCP